MVLSKQWREHVKHPDGRWVLLPLHYESCRVVVQKFGTQVHFMCIDLPGMPAKTMDVDAYRRQCKMLACPCAVGVFD